MGSKDRKIKKESFDRRTCVRLEKKLKTYTSKWVGHAGALISMDYGALEKVLGDDAKTHDVQGAMLEIVPKVSGKIGVFEKMYKDLRNRFPHHPIASVVYAASDATLGCYSYAAKRLSNELLGESAQGVYTVANELLDALDGLVTDVRIEKIRLDKKNR